MQKVRQIIYVLSFVAGIIYPATFAYASNLHFIAGVDYVNSDIKYSNEDEHLGPDDDYESISPVIGISAYGIGLEAFILNSNTIEQDSLETKLRAYGIAVFGEANLSDNFALIASHGLAEYQFTTKKDKIKY